MILFRIIGADQFDYQFNFESILDVTLFYGNKILPCVNDIYADTKSTERLSQVNTVHDEVLLFFIDGFHFVN